MKDPAVIWHEVECHAYRADLPLWRELAERERGPILDVGAGTGRVALDLAAAGHEVVALDLDPVLLGQIEGVPTVVADAQSFDLGREFGLILVPMQTIQLLEDRAAFLSSARRHLAPGGLLAIALADAMEAFDPSTPGLPDPDVVELDGWRFSSQPVALREHDSLMLIDRIRTTWSPDGRRVSESDRIALARLDAATLEAEAEGLLAAEPRRTIAPTDDHVGSTVVMLRG
jgi:SAM-dependent methyltransferase